MAMAAKVAPAKAIVTGPPIMLATTASGAAAIPARSPSSAAVIPNIVVDLTVAQRSSPVSADALLVHSIAPAYVFASATVPITPAALAVGTTTAATTLWKSIGTVP